MNNNYNNLFKERGYPLNAIGSSEIALEKEDALQALDFLMTDKKVVLGGDVLTLKNEKPEHTYDSWSFDASNLPNASEESIELARTYINQYPIDSTDENNKIIFVLVVK